MTVQHPSMIQYLPVSEFPTDLTVDWQSDASVLNDNNDESPAASTSISSYNSCDDTFNFARDLNLLENDTCNNFELLCDSHPNQFAYDGTWDVEGFQARTSIMQQWELPKYEFSFLTKGRQPDTEDSCSPSAFESTKLIQDASSHSSEVDLHPVPRSPVVERKEAPLLTSHRKNSRTDKVCPSKKCKKKSVKLPSKKGKKIALQTRSQIKAKASATTSNGKSVSTARSSKPCFTKSQTLHSPTLKSSPSNTPIRKVREDIARRELSSLSSISTLQEDKVTSDEPASTATSVSATSPIGDWHTASSAKTNPDSGVQDFDFDSEFLPSESERDDDDYDDDYALYESRKLCSLINSKSRRKKLLYRQKGGPVAATPITEKYDENKVRWLSFVYTRQGHKYNVHIRADIDQVSIPDLPREFKDKFTLYPGAVQSKEEYKGKRYDYEQTCNNIGWALAELNPALRCQRGLLQRAVDSWRNASGDMSIMSRRARRAALNSSYMTAQGSH